MVNSTIGAYPIEIRVRWLKDWVNWYGLPDWIDSGGNHIWRNRDRHLAGGGAIPDCVLARNHVRQAYVQRITGSRAGSALSSPVIEPGTAASLPTEMATFKDKESK